MRSIHTEFSPVELLLHNRLSWLELDTPRLYVRTDANGNVNVEPFTRLEQDLTIDRINVHDGRVTIKLADDPRAVWLKVPNFQLDAGRIREITMSAALVQANGVGEAPVSLSPGAAADPATAVSASLTFSNVDLSQLPIDALGLLPVRKLAGRCDGSIDLEVHRNGAVGAFGFNVRVKQLAVEPVGGMTLPVIDEAGVRLTASYDHLTRAVHLDSMTLRLPGVDLTGRAEVFAQVFAGHWEAIESLDVTGTLYPAQLAVLLTGKRLLPGQLAATGPVEVAASAQRKGAKLHLRLTAEATGADVRRGPAVLKPAGRRCDMGLVGDLDHRTSGFTVEDSWLELAGNRFSGRGALVSLRRLAQRLEARQDSPVGEIVLAELARLDWSGSWEIHDPAALVDLIPTEPARRPWRDVQLTGELTGRWFIHHGADTRVHASFTAPPETELAVSGYFAKPPAAPLHLNFDAAIDANAAALRDLEIGLTVADGRLGVDRADLTFRGLGDPANREKFTFAGRFSAEKVRTLLACLPAAGEFRDRVRGAIDGQFDLQIGPETRHVKLSADLTETDMDLHPWLDKPSREKSVLLLSLFHNFAAEGVKANLLSCTWILEPGTAVLNCRFPEPTPEARGARLPVGPSWELPVERAEWSVGAEVEDLEAMKKLSPALAGHLAGAELSGQVKFDANGTLTDGLLEAHAKLDATKLRYADPAPGGRMKRAGTPLVLRATGSLARDGELLIADIPTARLEFADSHMDLTARGELLPAKLFKGPRSWPDPGLQGFHVDANASVAVAEPLARLLPELDRLARRHGAKGKFSVRSSAGFDGKELHVDTHLDASQLAVAKLLATPGAPKALKPPRMPASVDLAFTCPVNLSRIDAHDVRLRLGDLRMLAEASAEMLLGPGGLPVKFGRITGDVSGSIRRARGLAELLPDLAAIELTGGLFFDAAISDAAVAGISSVTIHFDGLGGRWRGKAVSVDGEVLLEKLRPRWPIAPVGRLDPNRPQTARFVEENLPRLGRLRTEGLEFRAGGSHGWIVADLASLPAEPAGSLNVLAERLDLDELSRWLSPPQPPPATTQPATQPARPAYKLTEQQTEAVRAQARKLAEAARKHLALARLEARLSVADFRTYDISVDQTYDLRRLELTASVADGRVKVAYAGGLNGGVKRDRYSTFLTDPSPTVECESVLSNVLAEENIQPQLAKFFPGNTVYGTFSRKEKFTAPLAEVLAVAIDPRYPLHPAGSGKTIATDGLTQGRAAPKFVTKLFPGLNLAKYRYNKMTAFAEMSADGLVKNDMVFDGVAYDLYMEGTTDADNVGRYEIGLILLGTPQSAEWNHTYRSGRIPILNFRARIEGGKMFDEEVSYLWPNETLFVIFLKNNIFYRIWLAAGKNKDQ